MAESAEYKTEYVTYDGENQQQVTLAVSGEDENHQQAQQVQYITQDGVHILPGQLASGTSGGVIQVHMSCIVKRTDFCLCGNKGADHSLHG